MEGVKVFHTVPYGILLRMESHTRDTWIDAAFGQFNRAGLASIKVESLSRDLYASKGSFYWHFDNRSDLIDAVMAKWESRETDQIIELTKEEGDPFERVVATFTLIGERMYERGGERTLYSEAEAEGVLPVVARVTQRRIDHIASLLLALDLDGSQERAALAVGAVIGLQQLVTGGWEPLGGSELTTMMVRMATAR